ncbi:hypothetical protein [Paraburkholderia phosphatilytica]|uniref:hypothetical protein n=1 Tax=Paraburkholderia phosphatilytica TaxID=2282883 RepID=UPI000E4B417A|nr:hypothetical protein [Paraburkholderia phosphatilytica]
MQVVICLTSFNRTDCARISMEIVKLNWAHKWPVVHACADPGYTRYIEDVLVRREPRPLTRGALDLLVASMQGAVDAFQADYVIHLEADTWVFDQNVLLRYIERLEQDPAALIAASSWSTDRLPEWRRSPELRRRLRARLATVLRPLGVRYGIRERKSISTQFFIAKCTPELLRTVSSLEVEDDAFLEKVLYRAVVERFGRRAVIDMPEREPVHPRYRNSCDALSLVCHHWPSAAEAPSMQDHPQLEATDCLRGKKECLERAKLHTHGPHMTRLLTSPDLSYYNGNAARGVGSALSHG